MGLDPAEEWRPIDGAPGYEVSSLGRVRSLPRVVVTRSGQRRRYRGKIIAAATFNQHGHLKVPVRFGLEVRLVYIHHLVTAAFHGPRPPGHEVAHDDGEHTNNVWTNLRWATPAENAADKRRHGTHMEGERHPSAILSAAQVSEARARRAAGETQRQVAARLGVARGTIASIDQGRSWTCHG